MSEQSSSRQAEQTGSSTDQPLYPRLPPNPTAESDDEDKPSRKMTPTEKLAIIERIIEAPDDTRKIQEAIQQALPSDVILNFREIQVAIHPDKFPDPVEKDKATRAFQKLGFLRDNVGAKSDEVDTTNHFSFGNDPNRPHVEGKLSPYHDKAHEKATPLLQVLYKALVDNPSLQLDKSPSAVRHSVSKLDEINGQIREHNGKNSQDSDLGIIRYHDLLGKWRPILLLEDDDTKKFLRQSLLAYCEQMMYPPTWANPTPSNGPTTGQPGQAPESQSTSHAITSGAENDSTTFQAPNQTAAAPPLDPSQQQPSTNMATASVPQIQNSHQTFNMQGISETSIPQAAGGQKRVIAVRPRKTRRAVQPGFTSTGEKILFIQSVGRYARFVVTDTEGNIRLVSGSQPAIDLANSAGVPHTLQDPAEIQKLRGLVRRGGGEYGLEFVAIGEWDIGNTRLPFIVVGFYYENENGRREEAISRSSLIKILGTREGEKLIVESIVGHPDLSLREALEAQIAPRKQEVSSNNAPQLLLQGEQSQPWWFQTPQHSGSHTAFKVAPAQQAPYPNHFQQFASQQSLRPISLQYQQPFPSQFQPGPFAMPPQPILNSSMMKPRANSPTTSMMSEEL